MNMALPKTSETTGADPWLEQTTIRIDHVRREKWEPRLRRTRLKGTAGIISDMFRHDGRARRSEVEFVVSDRGRIVRERVVGAHDARPLTQIRFERSLEHVARIDEYDGVVSAQNPQVAAKFRQNLEVPVKIVGTHENDLDRLRTRRDGRGSSARCEHRQQDAREGSP